MEKKICLSRMLVIGSSLFILAVLVLEAIPYSIKMIFAAPPGIKRPMAFVSYFSIIPYGYADFFPLPTGLLTAAALALSALFFIPKFQTRRFRNALLTVTILVFLLSVFVFFPLPLWLLLIPINYPSTVFNYLIAIALLISCLLQIMAARFAHAVCCLNPGG